MRGGGGPSGTTGAPESATAGDGSTGTTTVGVGATDVGVGAGAGVGGASAGGGGAQRSSCRPPVRWNASTTQMPVIASNSEDSAAAVP